MTSLSWPFLDSITIQSRWSVTGVSECTTVLHNSANVTSNRIMLAWIAFQLKAGSSSHTRFTHFHTWLFVPGCTAVVRWFHSLDKIYFDSVIVHAAVPCLSIHMELREYLVLSCIRLDDGLRSMLWKVKTVSHWLARQHVITLIS